MLESRAWDQIVDKLREEDFYRHEHRLIFRTIGRLVEQSKPIDVLTVSESLRDMHELEQVGGDVYLFELANNTPVRQTLLPMLISCASVLFCGN